MSSLKVAILGCGIVGGGVAKILLELNEQLTQRTGKKIEIIRIVTPSIAKSAETYNIPRHLFSSQAEQISRDESSHHINDVILDPEIDLIVETIGGTSEWLREVLLKAIENGKHIVTANKALLAEYGQPLFAAAKKKKVSIGFEAAVCGAIPIIRSINDAFSGDQIESLSGIFNGTSNYILSKMTAEGLTFSHALKLAQDKGYAEADPTLDINGGDAGHKLVLLMQLAFGQSLEFKDLEMHGIEEITKDDLEFAEELNCVIKLICFAHKNSNNQLAAVVSPMMVKKDNFLSKVDGADNAVLVQNIYGGPHILVGKGAGSSETASSIVADIAFISRYKENEKDLIIPKASKKSGLNNLTLPYNIIFKTSDKPGITGAITTAIGNQNINIDTVGHNRQDKNNDTIFAIATLPCQKGDIDKAIQEIQDKNPGILLGSPKIIPVLQ